MNTTYKITDQDFLKPRQLLPQPYDLPNRTMKFSGHDSEKLFSENLLKQPASWKYRTKEVTYVLNHQFYRAPEWETIDWKNSVVILGCSNVFGVGLAEDETINHCLSQLIDRPVINLGVGGSGMSFAMQNSVVLNQNFPTPWAVINIWSDPYRIHEFVNKSSIKHYTASHDDKLHSKFWGRSEINPEMHSYFACKATEAIWSSKTKYLSYSHWESLDAESIKKLQLQEYDFARDMAHPGSRSAVHTAKILADALS